MLRKETYVRFTLVEFTQKVSKKLFSYLLCIVCMMCICVFLHYFLYLCVHACVCV